MKKLLLLLMMCSFFAATSVFGQQWGGASNANGGIYRLGNVGIGYANNVFVPQARLDINYSTSSSGQEGEAIFGPHIRLNRSSGIWDVTGGSTLDFGYGANASNISSVFSLNTSMLYYTGTQLRVATGENQLNIGAMTSPVGNSGQYFAFGANPSGSNSWQFTGNSTNNGGAIIHGDNQGNLFFITRGSGGSNILNPANNVRLRIHSNGKVSIGTGNTTNDPNENGDDYLLFVKGGTLSEEVAVKTGWADYVFDSNYTILPLEQVETFINTNGHLPNTPSAADLNGTVKLGEATVNQQEKIEEIYLHLIEMNKRMKALEAENDELKKEIEALKN
jgi:hypothetical protein